jgi:hypothetical protein
MGFLQKGALNISEASACTRKLSYAAGPKADFCGFIRKSRNCYADFSGN